MKKTAGELTFGQGETTSSWGETTLRWGKMTWAKQNWGETTVILLRCCMIVK